MIFVMLFSWDSIAKLFSFSGEIVDCIFLSVLVLKNFHVCGT